MDLIELGSILEISKGKKPSKCVDSQQEGCLPYVDIEAFEKRKIKYFTAGEKCLPCEEGDILIVCDGSRSGLVGRAIKGYVGSTLAKITANGVNNDYLYHFVQGKYALLNTRKKGTGTPHLDQELLKQQKLVVPSIDEQKMVVSRIEELFSELEAGVNTLRTIKEQLVVYRQAVLKAAYEGNLTKEWRKNNKKSNEWKVLSITDLVKKGKNSLKAGPFGSSLKKECYVPNGYKIYGQEQVIAGDETIGDYYINEEKYNELISCKVQPKDVLISLVGTVGKVLVLSDDCLEGIINPRLIKVSLDENTMCPYFFKYYFESGYLRSLYKEKAHGETMDVLNLGMIKELPFWWCPIDEQRQVVLEIESRMSACDNIEHLVNILLQQTEAMKQSILKEAYEGRL